MTHLVFGGLETDLIYGQDVDLPEFASFALLRTAEGRALHHEYAREQLDLARETDTTAVLDTWTWAATPDRAARLGIGNTDLQELVGLATRLMVEAKAARPEAASVVSGLVGPRDDGYVPSRMTDKDAQRYHAPQIEAMADAGAETIGAATIGDSAEAVGIVRAAAAAGLPVTVSFTLETDGRLPSRETLGDAIEAVDAATDAGAEHFALNCVHPDHAALALSTVGASAARIAGLVANPSKLSHAELDQATTLHTCEPAELAERIGALAKAHPHWSVLGGCCGTNISHLRAIAHMASSR